jgi:hypothetical protein
VREKGMVTMASVVNSNREGDRRKKLGKVTTRVGIWMFRRVFSKIFQ